MRGYDVNSFDGTECADNGLGSCQSFNRLVGSRMGVVNAELRFPLVGLFNRHSLYGPVPIELALFGDAGVAWSSNNALFPGSGQIVRSVGTAIRVNLLGFAVGELDYVHPLDRPTRGWLWEFNLIPRF